MVGSIAGIESKANARIIDVLRGVASVESAKVFGSRAKGNYREGSDIDIAVYGSKLEAGVRQKILEQYEALFLPWKLDVVIYADIEEAALREHIDRVGKKLF